MKIDSNFKLKKNRAGLVYTHRIDSRLRHVILNIATDTTIDIVQAEIWNVLSDVAFFSAHYSNMYTQKMFKMFKLKRNHDYTVLQIKREIVSDVHWHWKKIGLEKSKSAWQVRNINTIISVDLEKNIK